jgi:hypothetical protein
MSAVIFYTNFIFVEARDHSDTPVRAASLAKAGNRFDQDIVAVLPGRFCSPFALSEVSRLPRSRGLGAVFYG